MKLIWFCLMYQLFLALSFFFAFVGGQSDFDVRFDESKLEIYSSGSWYNLKDNIDYREGAPLCNALSSNYSLVDYTTIDVNNQEVADLDCVGEDVITECGLTIDTSHNKISNIMCMSNDGLQEGALCQLDDGRIVYLYQPEGRNYLVWAHVCLDNNPGWDMHAADLYCQGLGFENVIADQYKIEFEEKVDVFGLRGFDCSQATNFNECISIPRTGNARCHNGKVVKIQCENPITTPTTMSPTTIPTVQSISTSNDSLQASNPTTNDTSSVNTNATTVPANDTGNTDNNQMLMTIVGIIFVLVLLSLGLIGSFITLVILYVMFRRRRVKSKQMRYQHNLSVLVTKDKNFGQHYGQTSDYLIPNSDFEENYSRIEQMFDEDIYEAVVLGYEQYVPSSEERNYHTIKENKEALQQPSPDSLYQTSLFCESEYWEPGTTIEGIYAQMSCNHFREINKSELVEDKVMGEGNFGLVVSGNWKSKVGDVPVAMKSLKNGKEGSDVDFLQEAAILGQFNHPNVLKLLGMVTLTPPLTMVTELMRIGLKDFLINTRKSGEATFSNFGAVFLRFTNDIANGMQHLASKKFIHRDLAARNVLVSNNLKCKIGDFGLARHAIEDDEYYTSSGGLIPLKWTSPEALFYKKYSEKSDVWSYGITLYEIWSAGRAPLEGLKPDDIIQRVSDGVIMAPPSGCPMKVYELMVDCWNPTKDMRPSFTEIVLSLTGNDDAFLKRGNSLLEQMTFGEPPSITKNLFKDLQTKYSRV